ncbi:discoidin domain-containing protein [Longispora sp. K20-0274]|uniref:discoidin domain-containing protein n=1 Tax=Longispora sp. K20-0274 TaxID=3088255 RepID=UPI00399A014A
MRSSRVSRVAAVAALAVVAALTVGALPAAAANPAPDVVPALQEWAAGTGSLQLTPSTRIVVPAGASPRVGQLATQLVAEVAELTPLRPTTATGTPAQGDVTLRVDPNASYGAVQATLKPEAYRLDTTATGVTITGASDTGLYYGTRSLLQILVRGTTVPLGSAVDYPNYAVRGFMLDVGRRYFTPEFVKAYITWMGWLKLNTFQLHLNDNEIQAPNGDWTQAYSAFRLKSTNPAFSGLAATDGSYTRADWDSFEATAAAHAVTLVPEIDAPGHARAFVRAHPELGLNGGNSDNLDLSKAATTDYMKSVYSEFAPWFKGPALHMGADEYPGDKGLQRTYINTMAAHIRSLGKQVRIWGDFNSFPGGATGSDRDITVNSWNNGYYSGQNAIDDGYDVINSNDGNLYVVPFATYYHPQGLDGAWLYSNWEPNVFGGETVPAQHARLKGAMPAVWNDLVHATYTELDVHGLVKKSFAVLAQKEWSGTRSGTDYGAFVARVTAVGMGPGVGYIRPVVNPDDLALGRPTTASSQESSGLAPVFATDGEQSTRWASQYSDSQWIQVDLGATRTVGSVVLDWEGAYGKDYDIRVSPDGTTWTTVSQRRGRTTAGVDTIALTPVGTRYVRMQGVTRGTTYGYSLYRFEVLADATDLARAGTATASTQETANFPAARAIDGDPATRWSSAYTNGEWFQVDLGASKTVGRVVLTWEAAYGRDYDLQVSANGTTWTTVSARRGENGGVDDVTFTPTTARYVRMQGVTRGTSYGYSLYTCEIRSS